MYDIFIKFLKQKKAYNKYRNLFQLAWKNKKIKTRLEEAHPSKYLTKFILWTTSITTPVHYWIKLNHEWTDIVQEELDNGC